MLNNKSKLCIGMGMSCLLITQSMAYSLDSIKSINNQSVNHQRVLVSSAIHYNANGNMSTDNKGSSFSYNAANALTQVSLASGAKENDYYYANGLRAVAQSNTQVLVHYYSRHNQLLNTSDGAHSSTYLIANNVAARSVNGNATVLLHNSHGSVIAQLGDKPQFYQYSVYGVQRTEDGGQRTEFRGRKTDSGNGTLDLATNPLRYSGYMFDPLTGLYYLKARDYNPNLTSFMQVDSYAFNNQGLINGYFYGNNNPLMGIDPSGHKVNWKEALGVAGTVIASAIVGIGLGVGLGYGIKYRAGRIRAEKEITPLKSEDTEINNKGVVNNIIHNQLIKFQDDIYYLGLKFRQDNALKGIDKEGGKQAFVVMNTNQVKEFNNYQGLISTYTNNFTNSIGEIVRKHITLPIEVKRNLLDQLANRVFIDNLTKTFSKAYLNGIFELPQTTQRAVPNDFVYSIIHQEEVTESRYLGLRKETKLVETQINIELGGLTANHDLYHRLTDISNRVSAVRSRVEE
ncbi:RHS repeat-associated core domain-containing protein [Cysteiniphilum halobium]|uniref:RHS repeat-associated core domain-containing protein n=1 Tax=Cysteiniphilum halobium TaxID=2219059 RepID=UPI003F87F815